MTLDDICLMGLGAGVVCKNWLWSLIERGRQGRKEQPDEEGQALREGLCVEQVGMLMLKGQRNARSHQETFEELDDMCGTSTYRR